SGNAPGGYATGINAESPVGYATVPSYGSIAVASHYTATGIDISSGDGAGTVSVVTAGSIDVHANQYAVGIHGYSNYAADVDVTNGADITVVSDLGAAAGIFTSSGGADSTVVNSAGITVTTYGAGADAEGINAYAYNSLYVRSDG